MTNTLNIKAYPQLIPDQPDNALYGYIYFQAVDISQQPSVFSFVQFGSPEDNTASPPVYTDAEQAAEDLITAQGPALLDIVNAGAGGAYYTAYNLEFVDTPVSAAFSALKPVAFSGSYTDLTNQPSIPTIPTDISAFTNDSGYITSSALTGYLLASTASSTYVPKTVSVNGHALSGNITVTASDLGLATVASSGAYSDLSGKPSIPSATSQLTNDSNFITSTTAASTYVAQTVTVNGHALNGNIALSATDLSGFATVATSGSYNDLTSKPTIPSAVSQLTNDSGYITSSSLTGYVPTTRTVNGKALSSNITLTASDLSLATVASSGVYSDLSGKPSIPSAVSQLTNDSGYITSTTAAATYVAKTTTVNGHALSGNVTVTASDLSLATVATSGSYTDLINKPTIPNGVTVYNNTSVVSNPKIIQKSGSTVSGGTVTFYLTDDGTSTGNALLTNVNSVNVDINSSTSSFGYSWNVTNSNKTLIITVVQPGSLLGLGLIPFVSASSGVSVNVRVFGN